MRWLDVSAHHMHNETDRILPRHVAILLYTAVKSTSYNKEARGDALLSFLCYRKNTYQKKRSRSARLCMYRMQTDKD